MTPDGAGEPADAQPLCARQPARASTAPGHVPETGMTIAPSRAHERARNALAERKVVERAKGILMKDRALTEEQAYALLRKTAMNENRRLSDVAQSLIIAAGLLRYGTPSRRCLPAAS